MIDMDMVKINGVYRLEKKRESGIVDVEHGKNTITNTGRENIVRQLCQLSSGNFPKIFGVNSQARVLNNVATQIVAKKKVDTGPTYGAFFLRFIWVWGASEGASATWGTVEIYASESAGGSASDILMATINANNDVKGANEEWTLTYDFSIFGS